MPDNRHELTITHDERMLARPFGVECSCGFQAAAESEVEAQRIAAAHKIWQEKLERLKERGILAK